MMRTEQRLTLFRPYHIGREGYEFVGWYKDLSFNEPWDFENDVIPAKEYDQDGNYIFKETRIFAKWEESK